jgi:hypothetical protein
MDRIARPKSAVTGHHWFVNTVRAYGFPLEDAVSKGDHMLLRLHLSRGEGCTLRAMLTRDSGRRLLDVVVDRVVCAHDVSFYSGPGAAEVERVADYHETLRLLSSEFPAHRGHMLGRCMRPMFQLREACDLGVVECVRCISPTMEEFHVELAQLLEVAVRCNWTRTMDLLVDEHGLAFSNSVLCAPRCI